MYIHQVKLDSAGGIPYYGVKKSLAYIHPNRLPLCTRVQVDVMGDTCLGEVVGYGTDFKGFLKRIQRVVPRPEATHVLIEKDGAVWLLSNPSVPNPPRVPGKATEQVPGEDFVEWLERLARIGVHPDPAARFNADYVLVAGRGLDRNCTDTIQPATDSAEWCLDGAFPLHGAKLVKL